MQIVIGLFLIPVVFLIMRKANKVTTSKKVRIWLNVSLIAIVLLFILFCWLVPAEPFNLQIHYSVAYMIYSGEFILYSGLVFMVTPFMWMILVHFIKMIFRSIRVRKNAIIKRDDDFVYYRGDLDKISPAILMFVSKYEVDVRKSITATILKLKLRGYIKEIDSDFCVVLQDDSELSESEKMILELVRARCIRTPKFDKALYKKTVEKETLQNKYVRKNYGGIPFRILKMCLGIILPVIMLIFACWLDEYVHDNYWIYPEDDGYTYVVLADEEEARNLFENEIEDMNDYYHRMMGDDTIAYNYALIRADKFQYSVVRKAVCLNILGSFMIGFFVVFLLFGGYLFINQLCNLTKNYNRTVKGKVLLNKAYALKNYLKEYSLIKDRDAKELYLWEYYLVYAVVLDVNEKIEDDVIRKYLDGVSL